MTFEEAGKTKIRFGPYYEKTIAEIAQTGAGLLWLDQIWERRREYMCAGNKPLYLDRALEAYLSDRSIRAEIQRAMEAEV